MKKVDCTFHLNFSTKDADKLPTPRLMKQHLETVFGHALDNYLDNRDVEVEEVHFILGDELTIEDLDED